MLSALLAALNKAVPDNPRGEPTLVKQTLRVYDIVAVVSVIGTLAITAGLAYTGILIEMSGSAWLWALAFAAPTVSAPQPNTPPSSTSADGVLAPSTSPEPWPRSQ